MPAPHQSDTPSRGPTPLAEVPPLPMGEPAIPPPRASAGRFYLAGDIIAQKYRLTRLLGEGGMGAVWLARNLKLEVDVAIKLIRHQLGTPETAQRLLQEARAAARIGHRSIVRVFDFGETELDDPFIVMEVLTGESLRALLERKGRRLPAANAVRTLLPIASALCEAHAAGIVHRDLKPENIMLVPDTSGGVLPKLVDFGIAKLRRGDGSGEDEGAPSFVVGTPDYMSPEQAGGRDEVNEAADVWALAVILYESITGRMPFGGPTYAALIFSIMTEEPTPITEQAAGDARLWGILQEALAKQASQRPTMRAFGTALARWALSTGIESDVAGTSIAAHWLNTTAQSPFSALPPPMPADDEVDIVDPDVALPRPGGMPALRITMERSPDKGERETEAPRPAPLITPPETARAARGMSGVWIAVGGVVVAAAIVVVAGRRTPVLPLPLPALPVAASSAAPAPASATSAAPVAPEPTASAAPATPPAQPIQTVETAAPTASAASAPPRWTSKPPPPRLPRKSTLPIAKQPNF